MPLSLKLGTGQLRRTWKPPPCPWRRYQAIQTSCWRKRLLIEY
ncbi:hypothetical protein SK803_37960 [Lentzea sp. BCCO 10_0856]|uniref:Uncharacterized protein n=1 Tax=Lentzea miocenica TaxID=3095431 RepID=A0ABU4TCU6_9PSEU|nr:hypothetical protein [Lentzea sp. BCCO 10_0856]MDX8036014.1 hypothetical protein [Lentzea sp. BCCO 10_0856]